MGVKGGAQHKRNEGKNRREIHNKKSWIKKRDENSQSRMPTDSAISQYIVSMGLSLSLSIYIAFRAGRRLRNLTTENMEERLSDFTFDSLKELIADKLQTLLESEGIPLPAGISILDVAAHIHKSSNLKWSPEPSYPNRPPFFFLFFHAFRWSTTNHNSLEFFTTPTGLTESLSVWRESFYLNQECLNWRNSFRH